VDRTGRVDFSQPVRRLTEDEALALLRPSPLPRPPVLDPAPDAPTGWFARLVTFFSTLIRRA
jgi:lysozyme